MIIFFGGSELVAAADVTIGGLGQQLIIRKIKEDAMLKQLKSIV